MPVRRIGVVVPAHDEAALIGTCLQALSAAAAAVDVPVHAVMVLDACTDDTAEQVAVAAAEGLDGLARLDVLTVNARCVGAARRAGMARVLECDAAEDRIGLWLASTDADSQVPPDWFARQLAWADRGAQAVVGTVHVEDWTSWPPSTAREYLLRYRCADGHRHVHGANLSMSADSYLVAGGFDAVVSDEDVGLVDRLEQAGCRIRWAGDLSVLTSARVHGRAPDGFAGHLAALA